MSALDAYLNLYGDENMTKRYRDKLIKKFKNLSDNDRRKFELFAVEDQITGKNLQNIEDFEKILKNPDNENEIERTRPDKHSYTENYVQNYHSNGTSNQNLNNYPYFEEDSTPKFHDADNYGNDFYNNDNYNYCGSEVDTDVGPSVSEVAYEAYRKERKNRKKYDELETVTPIFIEETHQRKLVDQRHEEYDTKSDVSGAGSSAVTVISNPRSVNKPWNKKKVKDAENETKTKITKTEAKPVAESITPAAASLPPSSSKKTNAPPKTINLDQYNCAETFVQSVSSLAIFDDDSESRIENFYPNSIGSRLNNTNSGKSESTTKNSKVYSLGSSANQNQNSNYNLSSFCTGDIREYIGNADNLQRTKEQSQVKFLIEIFQRFGQKSAHRMNQIDSLTTLVFPIIDFQLYYFLPDENDQPALPNEIFIKNFSIKNGFENTFKTDPKTKFLANQHEYFTYIDECLHNNHMMGLKAEVKEYTNGSNKINFMEVDKSVMRFERNFGKIYLRVLESGYWMHQLLRFLRISTMKQEGGDEKFKDKNENDPNQKIDPTIPWLQYRNPDEIDDDNPDESDYSNKFNSSFLFFTSDVEKTTLSLECLAKACKKYDHFNKYVRRGIFHYKLLIIAIYSFHRPSKYFSYCNYFTLPYDRILHQTNFDCNFKTRCEFHKNDEVGETAKSCAMQNVYNVGYSWCEFFKGLFEKVEFKKGYHVPDL